MNWKQWLKIGLGAVLAIAFFIGLLAAKKKRKSEPILDVQVSFANQDLRFIHEEDIKELVNQFREEQEIEVEDIDLQEVENKILQNQFVSNCEAFINNKHHLVIDVKQKEPLFRVIHANGVSYYIDKNGLKFPKSNSFTASVPIVTGRVTYQIDSLGVQINEQMNNVVKLVNYAKEHDFVQALLATIDVQKNGDMVMTSRVEGYQINLGNAENLDDKFYRIKTLLQEGMPRVGWDKYTQFSVKYENQIIAKKK